MSRPFKLKYKNSAFPFKSPLKKDKLSKKTVKKYKEKGISKEELEALNTTPSDTVLSVRNHPDLGASSRHLIDEAKFINFDSGKIRPDEHGNWEQDTRVHRGDKGYTRYSKFKKQ
jgi:hypothetical protein